MEALLQGEHLRPLPTDLLSHIFVKITTTFYTVFYKKHRKYIIQGAMNVKEISQRIRALRETAKVSQYKIAQLIGTNQSAINRYENNQSVPPPQILLWYADYFDVSMDYLYARTNNPQGKLYEYNPKISAESEQFRQFIEMCFDPESPMNEKLKQTLIDMVSKK